MGDTRQACRHCRQPVTVAATGDAPEHVGKAVHTATGEEWCADGLHLAAPIDPAITGSAPQDRKPTPAELGIDLAALQWERSGTGEGSLEVAFPHGPSGGWVLMRKAGDPEGRVLVFDRNEWDCFLDGVRGGEFDRAGAT